MHRRMDAWLLVAVTLAAWLAPTAIFGGEIRLNDGTVRLTATTAFRNEPA